MAIFKYLHKGHSIEITYIVMGKSAALHLKQLTGITRGGLAIGRTGRIPGGLAANLARCPIFFY